MRITFTCANFGALHSEGRIPFFHNALFRNRLREAGPACAAVEFIERAEERLASDQIDINSGLVIVPVGVLKWSFRAAFSRYTILVFGQPASQLGVAGNWFVGIHLLNFLFLCLSVPEQNRADNHNNSANQTNPQSFMRAVLMWQSCESCA